MSENLPSTATTASPKSDFEDYLKGKYIHCKFKGKSKSGKTEIYDVITEDSEVLGQIKWYPRWRCYAFHIGEWVFEEHCLMDLSKFTGRLSFRQREKKCMEALTK